MGDRQLLSELLKEDQEPFQLKSYIEQRRTQLQIKKRNPKILQTPTKRTNLCKHACFFSFQNSPDIRKSPFHDFYSPCKSPKGAVFLHIPAGTAALLSEAAMRIEKQKPKPKTQIKNVGFGLFGSILKRLKDRNKSKKRAIGEAKLEKPETMEAEIRISCSCNNSRLSSAGWSEYNEEKSMDLETSTSSCSRSEDSEIIISCENRFCISPFRFSLQTSPSISGHRTPDFCSPSASPNRHKKQVCLFILALFLFLGKLLLHSLFLRILRLSLEVNTKIYSNDDKKLNILLKRKKIIFPKHKRKVVIRSN